MPSRCKYSVTTLRPVTNQLQQEGEARRAAEVVSSQVQPIFNRLLTGRSANTPDDPIVLDDDDEDDK
jgi:hypothetical protein